MNEVFIRSIKHSISDSNTRKMKNLNAFLTEYQRIGQLIIDKIWTNGYGDFNLTGDKLDFPNYINYVNLNIETTLSGRALSSVATQVSGIISAAVGKRKKRLWLVEKIKSEGKPFSKICKSLNTKEFKCVKPKMPFNAQLNSLCGDFLNSEGHFSIFCRLKSLGKTFGQIKIPIKLNRRDSFWKSKNGKRLNGFLLTKKNITLNYELPKIEKTGPVTVGVDQGLKTVVTLSNGAKTPDVDSHGHSLISICDKIAKKTKGTKAFKKAVQHRKNFVNWSVNQLNLSGVDEIRVEEIININFGRRASRKMQAWSNVEIREKLKSFAEENEVRFVLQSSTYRSQRCSCCGQVRKANRSSKVYSCKNCGNTMDADENAAKNHEINLPELPFNIRRHKFNLGNGFFWKSNGVFNYDGSELVVPVSPNKE